MAGVPVAKATQLTEGEKSDILKYWKKGWSTEDLAEEFGRDPTTIRRFLNTLRDTSDLAQARLKSELSSLVGRLIDKAEPSHIIDILSRPNIGVLEPMAKAPAGGNGGNVGIIFNVQPSNLAAVGETYGNVSEVSEAPVRVLEGEVEPSLPGRTIRIGSVAIGETSVPLQAPQREVEGGVPRRTSAFKPHEPDEG